MQKLLREIIQIELEVIRTHQPYYKPQAPKRDGL